MVKSPKFGKKLIFALGILIAIFVALYFVSSFSPFSKKPRQAIKPSTDQKELIDSFGYPDTFTLTMMEGVRYEAWNYYAVGKSFVFLNGTFTEDQEIEKLGDEYRYADFKPTNFREDMSLKDVKKSLGDPTIEADVNDKLVKNAKIYDFWDQVKVGTKDGKIVYVETLPVFIPKEYQVNEE